MEFPKGVPAVLSGFRGRGASEKSWNVIVFKVGLSNDGKTYVTAEFGYKGAFWTLNKFGDVKRVSNGKYVTLCMLATLKLKG